MINERVTTRVRAVDRVEDLGEDEDVEHESRHNQVSVVH